MYMEQIVHEKWAKTRGKNHLTIRKQNGFPTGDPEQGSNHCSVET